MSIIYTRWLMRFFKIRLVYLTFELFFSNPGKCFKFCLGYQPVTQNSNKPDKWLRSDTMLKSILVYVLMILKQLSIVKIRIYRK